MAYAKSLSIFDDISAEVNREARALGINLLNGLVMLTPVDTGRAKGNWFVGLNKSVRTIEEDRRQSAALSEGLNVIGGAKSIKYPEIVLSNNLPYIEPLNTGTSDQAPSMFIETEIDRVVNARNKNG